MMPADSGEISALQEFVALSPEDRRQIVRHLTLVERRALERVIADAGKPDPVDLLPDLALDGYSPWLAKHARRLLSKRDPSAAVRATPAARQALRKLLETRADPTRSERLKNLD